MGEHLNHGHHQAAAHHYGQCLAGLVAPVEDGVDVAGDDEGAVGPPVADNRAVIDVGG